MGQATQLAVGGLPGSAFVLAGGSIEVAVLTVAAGETYADGAFAGETYTDGAFAGDTYVDGGIEGEAAP